jgi:hypothetical protein
LRSGSDGDQRQAEPACAMRLFKDFAGLISAASAAIRTTGTAAEFGQRANAGKGSLADRAFGDGIADADVHGNI